MRKAIIAVGLANIILVIAFTGFYFYSSYRLNSEFKKPEGQVYSVDTVDPFTTQIDGNWLRKEREGLWTLHTYGSPMNQGIISGVLSKELIYRQEKAFVEQIRKIVPSEGYLKFLKFLVTTFNYRLRETIPMENKEEIFGIALSASEQFDFISSGYPRILNYHGAHDLGHLLSNLGMVGCTSFGVWNTKTTDGKLLIGRNFDFYMGDDFAKEKIVHFIRPDSGFGLAMVTWGGMTGVVSGMNEMGLTVTINASNSDISVGLATPVSIVARHILQYAANIGEAIKIAGRFDVFVSELFLIGSATDNRAIIIEKRPGGQCIYDPHGNSIISANHFQSPCFAYEKTSVQQRLNTASGPRFLRLRKLIDEAGPLTPALVVEILRDIKGLTGNDIGLGNEQSIYQFIGHHSIVFSPSDRFFWLSTSPYQSGEFVAYDLRSIFNSLPESSLHVKYMIDSLNIPADTMSLRHDIPGIIKYRALKRGLHSDKANFEQVDSLIHYNSGYFEPYEIKGDLLQEKNRPDEAKALYQKALDCTPPTLSDKERILEKLHKIN